MIAESPAALHCPQAKWDAFSGPFFRFHQHPGGFGFCGLKVGNPIESPGDIGFAVDFAQANECAVQLLQGDGMGLQRLAMGSERLEDLIRPPRKAGQIAIPDSRYESPPEVIESIYLYPC